MIYKEAITDKVTKVTENTEMCLCYVYSINEKEVLQAYKSYLLYSYGNVIYSEILENGTRKTISKELFGSKLNQILS